MSAEAGILGAPDEAAPGESFGVSLSVWENASYSLEITAPAGRVWSESNASVRAGYVATVELRVTEAWGFGRGRVEAFIVPANDTVNRTVLVQEFKIICEYGCMARLFNAQLAPVVSALYTIVGLALVGALLFVGHASHVYALDTGDLSWWERLNMVFALSLHRSPDKRDWIDATGAISGETKKQQQAVLRLADLLHRRERSMKAMRRYERWRDWIEDRVREMR